MKLMVLRMKNYQMRSGGAELSSEVHLICITSHLFHPLSQILVKREPNNGLKGLVKNMARSPQGNDRSQLMAVANGVADLAIANTYYIGIMLSGKGGDEQQKAAEKLKVAFPNQNDRGAHVNISGGGILKYSPNKDNAEKFLEFFIKRRSTISHS